MTEIYLILDDEPLDRRSITLVDSEEKAELLTKDSEYMFYQKVDVLSDDDVKSMLCDKRLNKVDDWQSFYTAHCEDCNVRFNEDCPHIPMKP